MDLLDLAEPKFEDKDAEAAYRAGVGKLEPVRAPQFQGGYVETPEQLAERSKPHAKARIATFESKLARGLSDTILTLPREDKRELDDLIQKLRDHYFTETGTRPPAGMAVLMYLREAGMA